MSSGRQASRTASPSAGCGWPSFWRITIDGAAFALALKQPVIALEDAGHDLRREPRVAEADPLGADADRHGTDDACRRRRAPGAGDQPRRGGGPVDRRGEIVGLAQKLGHEGGSRPLVGLLRRADLLDAALTHHDDAVGQRHRLVLIVGDEDRGGADGALDLTQLDLHALAQLGVQIRQRLIEQQHARPDHQRAGERHALLLAAGHPARITLLIAGEPNHRQRGADALIALGARHAPHLEAKGDILGRRHMREQRIALEYDAEAAPGRMHRGQVLPLQADRTARGIEKARDHLQGRGLAAAGGTEEGDELALADRKAEIVDDGLRPELLADAIEIEMGHGLLFRCCDQLSARPRDSSAWSTPRASR